jgi:uncharacterized repeat protein (TIGR04076 family)
MKQVIRGKNENCKDDRRTFCKKATCAAVGIVSSSGLLANFSSNTFSFDIPIVQQVNDMPNIIKAKVISQEGTCDCGHKVGDEIFFKEDGVEGKICIHALYSFLPKVFAMMYDANFPWLDNPDVSTSACPDAKNPVVFEISRNQ